MVARIAGTLGLVLLCALAYLPGLADLPVIDRDEARFAQASRQMIESGDYVRIQFQDQPRSKKPAGIYWLQAASARLGGDDPANPNIFWYRIPSAIGATLAVVLTFLFARRWSSDQEAWLAAALLAVCAVLVLEAHLATSDAVLLATVVLAQGMLGITYVEREQTAPMPWWQTTLFWLALACGTLIKGPIAPGVSVLTALTLGVADRRWAWLKRLRPLVGVPLFLIVVLPWLWAIQQATDGAFLREALGDDFFGKIVSERESHGGWPGYYLVLLVITFWPGSLFAGLAITDAFKRRCRPLDRFCLAWLIPFWIVLELVPTKLPHYLMPAYPALAILTARAVAAASRSRPAPWRALAARVGFVFWAVLTMALAGAVFAGSHYFGGEVSVALVASGVIVAVGAIVALFGAWRMQAMRAAVVGIVSAALFLALLYGGVLPSWSGIWLTREVERSIAEFNAAESAPKLSLVSSAGYHEPSLVFAFGTGIALVSPERTIELAMGRSAPSLAIVEDRLLGRFHDARLQFDLDCTEVAAVTGIHYSKGEWVTLRVFQITPN